MMILKDFIEFCGDLFVVILNTVIGLILIFIFCFLPLFSFFYVIMEILKLVVYLYREFSIKAVITPKIEKFIVQFKYKDEQLLQLKVKEIKELKEVINTLMKSKGEIIK